MTTAAPRRAAPAASPPTLRAVAALLALAAAAAAPAPARAEGATPTFSVERLDPLPAPSRNLLGVSKSDLLTHLDVEAGLTVHDAEDVWVVGSSSSKAGERAVVGRRLLLEPSLAVGLFDLVSVGVTAPLALSQTGAGLAADPPPAAFLGDVRAALKLRVLDPAQAAGFGVHVATQLHIPTGEPADLASDGALRVTPTLGLDWRHLRSGLAVTLNVGWAFRPTVRTVAYVSAPGLRFAAAVELPTGTRARFFGLVEGAVEVASGLAEGQPTVPLEAMGGIAFNPTSRLAVMIGGGGRLVESAGTASARVFASLSWRFLYDRDSDGDGLLEGEDRCPDAPEDIDGFEDDDGCPDLDNDGDGIPDTLDRCPDAPEDRDGNRDEDGCPDADDDGDGVPDALDRCPNAPEDVDGFEDEDGCPDPDNDGDGIPDALDQCPDEAEDLDGLLDDDGCVDVDADGDGFYDSEDACPEEPENYDGKDDDDGCPD